MEDELVELSATEVIERIAQGKLKAFSYVVALLGRVEKCADLSAIITLNRTEAITRAQYFDDLRKQGKQLPRLAGLVIIVKDNINTSFLPTSAGTPALSQMTPKSTAPSLQRLLDEGAIVLGKANMHELAYGITSSNASPFAGVVRNPLDKSLIPGGSSGGTSAAIAARIAPCGLGTDTGGSARIPASLTGTNGFRPSVGNGGQERRYHDENTVVPISHTRDTIGPMARSVPDLVLLDSVMAGTSPAFPVPLNGVRLGVPPSFWKDLDPQVEEICKQVLSDLSDAGVELILEDLANTLTLTSKISAPIALHETFTDLPVYLKASGYSLTLESLAAQIASPDVKKVFSHVLGNKLGAEYAEAMAVHRPALRAEFEAYLTTHKAQGIIFPTSILTARPIDYVNGSGTVLHNGREIDTFAAFTRNTEPGSLMGLPGVSLHVGLTTEGLPVGIEIDGPVGSDAFVLGLALSFEETMIKLPAPMIDS